MDPDEELDDDELEQLEREQEEDEAFLELDDDAPWAKAPPPTSATVRAAPKPGRNEACWCGSGKKYKKCHLDEDEAKARA
ncbi:MAG: SEC-C domain-containing protein [Deltaproteobacteria bacterium]|nr:SEC-C domain-containing protein [Deltaproteobacteria bacterium]